MTKILIIGDSISMGYTPLVAETLAGEATLRRSEGNAADSAHLLENVLDYLAADSDAALVHFNCGLHDIKRAFGSDRRQVPLVEYRKNLAEIVSRLAYRVPRVLWATTTPVLYDRHHAVKGFDRFEEDVAAYNAAAGEIAAAAGIGVSDLHAAIVAAGPEQCLGPDGVHMTDKGNAVLAEAVTRTLRAHLGEAS